MSHFMKKPREGPVEIKIIYDELRVMDPAANTLHISFQRTIRVPDNGVSYNLPPDLGTFPIHSIDKYSKRLPNNILAKGGVFIPIHRSLSLMNLKPRLPSILTITTEKEALWINFSSYSDHPFAVKVFVGGINVISGENYHATRGHARPVTSAKQDYIVVPGQLWLDGIATPGGKVMQFVAAPVGLGRSIEAQVNGSEKLAGIQFEIIPTFTKSGRFQIFIKDLTGKAPVLEVNSSMRIWTVKCMLRDLQGMLPQDQRLMFAGKQLDDWREYLWHPNTSETP